jgi:hypothetical protein
VEFHITVSYSMTIAKSGVIVLVFQDERNRNTQGSGSQRLRHSLRMPGYPSLAERHERTSQRSRVTYETVDAKGSVSMSDEFVMRPVRPVGAGLASGSIRPIHSCRPGDGHGLHVGGRPAGFTKSCYASAYKCCEGRPRTARPVRIRLPRIRLPDVSADRGHVKSKGRLSSHSNHYLDSTAQS